MLKNALPKIQTEVPGPKTKEHFARRDAAVLPALKCSLPVAINRGEGAMIEDLDGNIMLDWTGGVGVLNVGYSHPKIVQAVKEQSEKYLHQHISVVSQEGYIAVAEKLAEIAPLKGSGHNKVVFSNSGSEALENAVKIARVYTKRPNIIVFKNAFHGRTLLTMQMSANKKYTLGMGPFPDGVYRAEFPNLYRKPEGMTDAEAIDYYVERLKGLFVDATPADYVAAIVVEPIQGEGGIHVAPIEWVKAVRKICDEHGILLIADEVQSGNARAGRMYASETWKEAGCAPDIMTTAKSIGAGLPISAAVAPAEIADTLVPGLMGGTYNGNAVACAAALAVFDVIKEEKLVERSQVLGDRMMKEFMKWKDEFEEVGDVRGQGSFMGLEFVTDKKSKKPNAAVTEAIVQECAKNGLLLFKAALEGNVIRTLFPLVITDEQVEAGLQILHDAIAVSVAKA